MMKRQYKLSLSLLFLWVVVLTGCLKNDLDYPHIRVDITKFVARGQMTVRINTEDRTVTVTLADTVNLKQVYLQELQLTEGATGDLKEGMTMDLTSPQKYTFSLYQDYEWTVTAQQEIERVFRVEGQVGAETFQVEERIAIAQISKALSLEEVTLTALKLGPTGSLINNSSDLPSLEWEQFANYCRATVKVSFSHFIVDEEWTLYVFQTDATVSTSSVDAWTHVAWLYGEGLEGADNGFEIREATEQEWTQVDKSYLIVDGGSFSARVPHLKAETSYVFRAYSDDEYGASLSFTTEAAVELTDGTFDEWHLSGKVWNPWAAGAQSYWDTGNRGATTVGDSNTVPTDYVWPGKASGQAAHLNSRFVGVGTLGKFAAGNLFFGEYVETDVTNGILDFGRPFTARPTRLKGYYQYSNGIIDYLGDNEFPNLQDKPDSCFIYVALGDWTEPVRIRTRPSERKLFEKDDPHIIAYAEFISGVPTSSYQLLDLELEYRSTSRKPTYLVIVCTASKYGDYFVGSSASELFLDEFSLEYDY